MNGDSKVRVMHVNGWLETGGVEETMLIAAKHNLRDKYDLAFVSYRSRDGAAGVQIRALGYPVFGLDLSSRIYDVRIMPKLMKLFREFRPHIVHFYDKASILGRLAAKAAGVPVIISHEVNIDYSMGLRLAAFLKRQMNFLVDTVITCSEAVRQYRVKSSSEKSVVLHPPFDLSKFPLEPPPPSRNREKENGTRVIGIVSRISPEKGHRYLIRAMPRIVRFYPSARLKIVGTGPLIDEMRGLTNSLGLNDYVEFTGYVDDLLQALSSIDIFVLPSLTDGFPLSVMEAMAMGIPVAASAVDGIPEMVDDGETGILFPPGDPDAIADAVIEILKNYSRYREMGMRGMKKAMREFSPEVYIGKLDTIYQKLIEKKGIDNLISGK